MSVDARNRLQPSLLDRLTDDQRGERSMPAAARPAALAMRRTDAESRGIRCISDLADRSRVAGVRVGLSATFVEQSGGWPAFRKFYGLSLSSPAALPRSEAMDALLQDRADVVDLAPGTRVDDAVYRLVDDRRFFVIQEIETDPARVMSKAQLRQAVLRDLGALFNAVQSLSTDEAKAFPVLGDSVINYGMPPLTGQLASKLDVTRVIDAIRQTILRFEPRVLADTLDVRAIESDNVLDTHNVIEFEIRGHLWSQPLPIEILLRTQLDLEAGQVHVRDIASTSLR